MKRLLLAACLALWSASAWATCGGVPNTFVNGTIADASQVNANFTALVSCVNAIDAGQITTGTIASARLFGSYTGITAISTIGTGSGKTFLAGAGGAGSGVQVSIVDSGSGFSAAAGQLQILTSNSPQMTFAGGIIFTSALMAVGTNSLSSHVGLAVQNPGFGFASDGVQLSFLAGNVVQASITGTSFTSIVQFNAQGVGYSVNGTPGVTKTCSSLPVVAGGIVISC